MDTNQLQWDAKQSKGGWAAGGRGGQGAPRGACPTMCGAETRRATATAGLQPLSAGYHCAQPAGARGVHLPPPPVADAFCNQQQRLVWPWRSRGGDLAVVGVAVLGSDAQDDGHGGHSDGVVVGLQRAPVNRSAMAGRGSAPRGAAQPGQLQGGTGARPAAHGAPAIAHQHHELRHVVGLQAAGDVVRGAVAVGCLAGARAVVAGGLRGGRGTVWWRVHFRR